MQTDLPGSSVGRDLGARGHLRLGNAIGRHRVERVEDVMGVIGGDQGRRQDRIEQGQVRLRNELEGGRLGRLADRRSGETRGSERCRASGKKCAA
jgi:hypothetical protein